MRKNSLKKGETSMVAPEPGPIDSIDNLPNPIGVNMTAVKQAEQFAKNVPNNLDKKNDGGNPSIADISAFASGKDGRNFGGAGSSNSDPSPAMPGA
jgi:hypothetical protein